MGQPGGTVGLSASLSLNKVVVFGNASGDTHRRVSGATSDGSTAIDALWETKEFTATDFGIPDIDTLMRWTGLELWALGNSFDLLIQRTTGNPGHPPGRFPSRAITHKIARQSTCILMWFLLRSASGSRTRRRIKCLQSRNTR